MKYIYLSLFTLSLIAISCRKGKEMKTDSGFNYTLYTESKGPKPKLGDYVTILLSYRNENDSVFFDWKKSGVPIRFQLERIPFIGSFEDGLISLSENDSATFFVPADSLYNEYFKNGGTPQSSTAFKQGTLFKFDLRLLKVQTSAQAEEDMLLKQIDEEKGEREAINSYISNNKISFLPDSLGYYLFFIEKGKGAKVDSGKVITINYEGRFLNDSVFDGTKKSGKPYQFISGAHRVIEGWELALKNLNEGDRITLLVPSRLAYGSEGLRNPGSSTYDIAPNSPLIFDIEILKVEEMEAVSRR